MQVDCQDVLNHELQQRADAGLQISSWTKSVIHSLDQACEVHNFQQASEIHNLDQVSGVFRCVGKSAIQLII